MWRFGKCNEMSTKKNESDNVTNCVAELNLLEVSSIAARARVLQIKSSPFCYFVKSYLTKVIF